MRLLVLENVDMLAFHGVTTTSSLRGRGMSTSLLYHCFGVVGYRYVSQNFEAGMTTFRVERGGLNNLRVIAVKQGVTLTDELALTYQTEPWGDPVELRLSETARKDKLITVEAKVFDANGVFCLDAARLVRFSFSGEGSLIDNLGTTRASRQLQLANGRAEISLLHNGACRIEATIDGLPAATLNL